MPHKAGMVDTDQMSVRKIVSMSPTLAKRVENYRFQHRFKSEAEALRELIEGSLDDAE